MSQKHQPANRPSVDPVADPLDSILIAEFNSAEQIRPSSGFAASVMDAIHEQAVVPPPIPFPWKRVLPLAIAALCSLAGFVIWVALRSGSSISGDYGIRLPALTAIDATLCWIALAFGLTLIAVSSSFWLARGGQR